MRGLRLAILLSAAFWTAAIVVVVNVLKSCQAPPSAAAPTVPAGVAAFLAADERRDVMGVIAETAKVPAVAMARLAADPDDSREPEPVLQRVRPVKDSCGPGVRPFIWVRGEPSPGHVLRVVYDAYGAPRQEGDAYDWPFVFVLVEAQQGPLARPIELPGGCPLWINPESKTALCWSIGGRPGYRDPVLRVAESGRWADIEIFVQEVPGLMGRRLLTQMAVVDPPEGWKTSRVWEVTIGKALR